MPLFSPGEVGDHAKHWQRMSRRQGTRAAERYRNSRLSDQPSEDGAGTDPFEMCSDLRAVCLKPPSLSRHTIYFMGPVDIHPFNSTPTDARDGLDF